MIAVVGIGNELLKDEGFGIKALRALAQKPPEDVELIEGSTSGISLLRLFFEYEAIIFLDIIKCVDTPGSIYVFDLDDVPLKGGSVLSFHDIGLAEILSMARMTGSKAKTYVAGIVPEEFNGVGDVSETLMNKMEPFLYEVRVLIAKLAGNTGA